MRKVIAIATMDGTADGVMFHPEGTGSWPAVLVFMDAPGVRPGLEGMMERIASMGYCVLLPNLYYRLRPAGPVDREKEPELFMRLFNSLDHQIVARDTNVFVAFLDDAAPASASRIGCIGYCMGGGYALTAAADHPGRVAVAMSFHGGRLATDAPTSPHRRAAEMQADTYCGVAADDFERDPCETARLRGAFEAVGGRKEIELYPGCNHGWTVPTNRVYDRAGSERHFERIASWLAAALGR